MKRLINFLVLSVFIFSFFLFNSCKAQNNDTTTNKPKIDIKVNKEYDNNGNVIRYDSTYSYSYSSPGNSFQFNNGIIFKDSIFDNNFMFNDSLLNNNFYNSFFNNDFKNIFNFDLFDKQLIEQMKQFNEMMQQFQNKQNNRPTPNVKTEKNNQNDNESDKKEISL